jgi:hypothetical protein
LSSDVVNLPLSSSIPPLHCRPAADSRRMVPPGPATWHLSFPMKMCRHGGGILKSAELQRDDKVIVYWWRLLRGPDNTYTIDSINSIEVKL